MKRLRYCRVWILVSCLYAVPAGAVLTSHNNLSFVEIISNPNPKFESKPASTKYASVQFLTSDTQLTFSSDKIGVAAKCASLGYMVPVSKCTGSLKPSYLCSSDLHEAGAEGYTTNCCNSNLYTVSSPDMCTDNATALTESCYWGGSKKYRCACDRSRYPYSELSGEGCGSNGDFNVNNMCKAPDATGRKISYYGSCCPRSYEECDGSRHLVGKGNSCRVSKNGTIVNKYEYCECSSSYDTICADAMLIDSSDVCTDGKGRKFTRDNNCESGCTQTRETNIDSYLYGKIWHCLYKKDGATVKATEKDLCAGYDRNTQTQSAVYYDECTAQGYVKTVEDCYISDLIMRCPNDNAKVWCLDGKYCTGFPVGEDKGATACHDGAKMKLCGSREQGVRCAYDDERCNKCWEEGVYNSAAPGCENLDTSEKGDSEVCCKRGYKMNNNGICEVNVCDRTLFPYEQNPGSDQGVLELCYEGDQNATLGYKTYFGYAACNSNAATGGLWKQDDDNPRKCVCMRKDDDNTGRAWLPFDLSRYFTNNNDTSDGYIHIGFSKGQYGNTADCTDSEGSYYGYSSCFIGKTLGTTDINKGMCLQARLQGNRNVGYFHQGWGDDRYFYAMTIAAGAPITSWPNISKEVYCISRYNHCQSPTGQKLGDEGACALVVEGCNQGNEEACNQCYHVGNLVKDGNGLFTPHDKYRLKVYTYNNASTQLYVERCPDGYVKAGLICRKTCSVNDYASCGFGDILLDKDGVQIGGVYLNTLILYNEKSGTHKLGVSALTAVSTNWYDAKSYAVDYVPPAYKGTAKENDEVFGKGKWSLPVDRTGINQTLLQLYPYVYFGTWLEQEESTDYGYALNWVANAVVVAKTDNQGAVPVKVISYTY